MRTFKYSDFKRPTDWLKLPLQWFLRRLGQGVCLVLPKRYERQTNFDPHRVREVLVIRRNNLGDAVAASQCLNRLATDYPNINLTVLSTPYAAPVFETFLPVATTYSLSDGLSILHHLLGFGLPRKVRKTRFDWVLSLSDTFSSKAAAVLLSLKADYRVIVGTVGESVFLNGFDRVVDAKRLDEEGGHIVHRFAEIIRGGGFDLAPISRPTLSGLSRDALRKIALFPECNRPESAWSIQRYQDTCNQVEALGYLPRLYVSPKFKAGRLSLDHQITVLASTADLIKAVSDSDLVICSEGGVSHIASALRKPSIVISGVKIEGLWDPFDFYHTLLEVPPPANLGVRVSDVIRSLELLRKTLM